MTSLATPKPLKFGREKIRVAQGKRHQAIEQTWEILQRTNNPAKLFLQGTAIVRLEDDGERLALVPMTKDAILGELDRRISYEKMTKDGPIPIDAPTKYPSLLFDDARERKLLPRVTRLVTTPVFTSKGNLIQTPGYHPDAEVFLDLRIEVPHVSKVPSGEEVSKAIELLTVDLMGDFPFEGLSDKVNALGLILSPFVREMINGPVPLVLVTKKQHGVGASLLVDCGLYIALCEFPQVSPYVPDLRQESSWQLTYLLASGRPAIYFDNLEDLRGSVLSAALTSTRWTGRLVGGGKFVEVENRAIWVGTGVKPAMETELARRIVPVELADCGSEAWLRRNFRHPNLREWVARNHGELLWACLTLIQNWIAKGKRSVDVENRLGSFESYCEVIGGILEAAAIDDFLRNIPRFYSRNLRSPDAGLETLVELWHQEFSTRNVRATELIAAFPHAVRNLGIDDENPLDLGKYLGMRVERKFGKFRIAKAPSGKGFRLSQS